MVWAKITSEYHNPLVFVEWRVKINAHLYWEDILEKVVKPWAKNSYEDSHWIFQQDLAPTHKAKIVQEYSRDNFPDFISMTKWPSYSLDLNPMDYSVWGVFGGKGLLSLPSKSLKVALQQEWELILVEYLQATAENFVKRLELGILLKVKPIE
uniref:Tc1-like transposase DDE domain-containing protein n=1 Tax=Plectus sambesii TaxID=2011161 RepID=A0A914UZV3_9BILA